MTKNHHLNFFSQPYPFYYNGKSLFFISLLIFVLTFFFNYVFKPFNLLVDEHKFGYSRICVIHAIVAVLAFAIIVAVVNIKSGNNERWTVKSEFLFIVSTLIFIGISQFLIRDYIYTNPNNWSLNYLFEEIVHTFLEGLIFILIIVPLNFNYLFYQNSKRAKEFELNQTGNKTSSLITIETQVKDETFDLDISKLLFVKADGNYIEIYLNDNNQLEKLVKRLTIKDFLTKLSAFPSIVKTHRSYLVNINKIINVEGNAQGYRLKLKLYSREIPVSRNLISHFNEKMQELEK